MYLPVPSDPEAKKRLWDKLKDVGITNHLKKKNWPDDRTKLDSLQWLRVCSTDFTTGIDAPTMVRWSDQRNLADTLSPETAHQLVKSMFDIVQDAGIVGNTLMQDEELLDSIIQSYMEKLQHERI